MKTGRTTRANHRAHDATAPYGASIALGEPVVAAARELLGGFHEADGCVGGRSFEVYDKARLSELQGAVASVLMRIVFVLFAEGRRLLPVQQSEAYAARFGLTRLHGRLLTDYSRVGDALGRQFGAWERIVGLFRALHAGAVVADGLVLPARHGSFFDPEAFPFLEGRSRGEPYTPDGPRELPRISDRVVLRVLDPLCMIDGERIRYEALDVEQLGGAYEGLVGLDVVAAQETTVRTNANPAHLPDESRSVELLLRPGENRRRTGSHYTPRALTQPIVEATLRPILVRLGGDVRPEQLLALKVCDPAMGSGAFLLESCRQLGDSLVDAWRRTATTPALRGEDTLERHAQRLIARRCLYGVDRSPFAVELARCSMWLLTAAHASASAFTFVDHALRCGDSLVGLSREQIISSSTAVDLGSPVSMSHGRIERAVTRAETLRRELFAADDALDARRCEALLSIARDELDPVRSLADRALSAWLAAAPHPALRTNSRAPGRKTSVGSHGGACDAEHHDAVRGLGEGPDAIEPFHWEIEFPEVFVRHDENSRCGFDAIVGNPPWVSYAGRAAQPLDDRRRAFYGAFYQSFARYRNLQGLFVEAAVRMLAQGGRLGLVLPSSMAELDGYVPTRTAHDALAYCDPELPDLGETSFRGVNQPSMVLLSTRRAVGDTGSSREVGAWWPLARPDLDEPARRLLARLSGPALPATLFGERGLQTEGSDQQHLRDRPDGTTTVPLRAGGDIQAFLRGAAGRHAELAWFGSRLRDPAQWSRVRVLVRQTARVPIAVRSDGQAFRNSILAGFDDPVYSADFLVAYLNSTPVRWLHYVRNRDARLGMPQVKIGHLRAIPAPLDPAAIARIALLGREWSLRNTGVSVEEQEQLDGLVADGLALEPEELARMRRDAAAWS